jgi:hypothetical protein
MDAVDAFGASLTVTEAGASTPGTFGDINGDGEHRRGGRGGGGAVKSMSNIARGGGGSGPALEWTPGW